MCMSGRKHFPTSLPPTFRFFYPFWNSEDWPQYLSNGATAVVGHSMVSLSRDCSRYSSVCDCSGPALSPTVIDLHRDLELLTAQWQYLTVRWIQHLMFLTGVRVLTVSITIWFLYCYVFFVFHTGPELNSWNWYIFCYTQLSHNCYDVSNCVTSVMLTVLHSLDPTSLCSATSGKIFGLAYY